MASESHLPSANRLQLARVPHLGRAGGGVLAAETIAAAARLITQFRENPGMTSMLDLQALNSQELDCGAVLVAAAEEDFNACELELAAFEAAVRRRDDAWVDAREQYLLFREVARARYGEAGLRALRVIGPVRASLPEFVEQAGASYQAARSARFAGGLARGGFAPATVRDAVEGVERLARADAQVQARQRALQRRADERDVAIAMLNRWVQKLLQAVSGAFGRSLPPTARGGAGRSRTPAVVDRRNGRGPRRSSSPYRR